MHEPSNGSYRQWSQTNVLSYDFWLSDQSALERRRLTVVNSYIPRISIHMQGGIFSAALEKFWSYTLLNVTYN